MKFWTGWDDVADRDSDLITGLFYAIVCSPLPEVEPKREVSWQEVTLRCPADRELPGKTLPMGEVSFGQALEALQTDYVLKDQPDRLLHIAQCWCEIEVKESRSHNDVAELLCSMPLPIFLTVNEAFMQFRQNILDSYASLFEGGAGSGMQKAGLGRLQRFGWYNLLYEASGGRVEVFEQIKQMNVHTVLQYLVRHREEQRFIYSVRQIQAYETNVQNRR